ncbi:MAG: hypothetical protein IJ169_03615 [Paludibacteraceae bacterium]|nr:hypothetical protein [Paludibacteraceae bacterium]
MKKTFTLLLLCLSAGAYALQIADSLFISPSDNVVNLVMAASDYDRWIADDGFQRSGQPYVITSKLYTYFKDDFDVIMLITNENELPQTIPYYGINRTVSNSVKGIGLSVFSQASYYGSAGKLFSLMHLPYRDAIKYGPTLHEFCHCWANYAIPTAVGGHWGICGGSSKGQLGGFKQSTLMTQVDGIAKKYSAEAFGVNANGGNSVPYNEMELYLMGMLPIDSVQEFDAFPVFPVVPPYYDDSHKRISFISDTRIRYTPALIVDSLGPRVPDYTTSQKEFKALFVVLSRQPLTADEWSQYESSIGWFCKQEKGGLYGLYNFWEATRGIGSINPSGLSRSLKGIPSRLDSDTPVDINTLPGTIVCEDTFRIYNLSGQDVTARNGALPTGIYIVRTADGSRKIWLQ